MTSTRQHYGHNSISDYERIIYLPRQHFYNRIHDQLKTVELAPAWIKCNFYHWF